MVLGVLSVAQHYVGDDNPYLVHFRWNERSRKMLHRLKAMKKDSSDDGETVVDDSTIKEPHHQRIVE